MLELLWRQHRAGVDLVERSTSTVGYVGTVILLLAGAWPEGVVAKVGIALGMLDEADPVGGVWAGNAQLGVLLLL